MRLSLLPGNVPYLPDFWLPDLGLFAEVKGELPTEADLVRLVNVAASLSCSDGGGCHDDGGNDVVILGPIPESPVWAPWRLHMHKGTLDMEPWDGWDGNGQCSWNPRHLAGDYGGTTWEQIGALAGAAEGVSKWKFARDILLHGGFAAYQGDEPPWEDAYRAARQARFEHGEHG